MSGNSHEYACPEETGRVSYRPHILPSLPEPARQASPPIGEQRQRSHVSGIDWPLVGHGVPHSMTSTVTCQGWTARAGPRGASHLQAGLCRAAAQVSGSSFELVWVSIPRPVVGGGWWGSAEGEVCRRGAEDLTFQRLEGSWWF